MEISKLQLKYITYCALHIRTRYTSEKYIKRIVTDNRVKCYIKGWSIRSSGYRDISEDHALRRKFMGIHVGIISLNPSIVSIHRCISIRDISTAPL